MSEADLIRDYADLGVTCGYIGNVEFGRDYRSFRVFTRLTSRPEAPTAGKVSIPVFDPPYGGPVWKDAVEFDTPQIRARLDKVRERFERGELSAPWGI